MEGATFDKLMQLLGTDREQAALEYRRLHERLTRYFDWNGGEDPPALADAAIDRIGKRLERSDEEDPIQNVFAFALGVARHLLQEDVRQRKKATEMGALWSAMSPSSPAEEKERLDEALLHCLAQLPPERRNLIEAYYVHRENKSQSHQRLAMKYGITINALRTRALRVRQELEIAILHYLEGKTW